MVDMPKPAKYDEFMGPGLYSFYNDDSSTVLENSGQDDNMVQGGTPGKLSNNQKWLVADVGAHKVVFISRANMEMINATGVDTQAKTVDDTPESTANKWYIEHSDEDYKKVYIKSVTYPGYVLTLNNGDAKDGTPVNIERMDDNVKGQVWFMQKLD